MTQSRTKTGRAYSHILASIESRSYYTVAIIIVLSCVAAGFCSPYPASIASNLLVIAVTVFSIFIVVYIFLRNRLQSQVNSIEIEIGGIGKVWRKKRYEYAKQAIIGYESQYKHAFLYILLAECLLMVSILLSIYTVFIDNYWWVETIGLGFIISALILLILMLLIYHRYPGREDLFSKLGLYLESIHDKYKKHRRGEAVSNKKRLSSK